MTLAQIMAAHGSIESGGASSFGIGSADVDLSTDDAVFLPSKIPCSLFVTADGDVKFMGADGSDDTWSSMSAGDYIPIAVQKVYKTGTTASVKAIY